MPTDSSVPDRPPLDAAALTHALVRHGGLWRRVDVVPETGSTNTDLLSRARDGAAEGAVLVAEHQSAGRGRLGRAFHTPPRVALTFSVLVRPNVPPGRYGWLPLVMGTAVVAAVAEVAGVSASLKWPNDVLVGSGTEERKLVGILSEAAASAAGTAIVIGAGINVSQSRSELPVPTATSLAVEGARSLDRGALLRACLSAFERRYRAWRDHRGDAAAAGIAAEYRDRCRTLGRTVRVELPGGRSLLGTATGVDASGCLEVRGADGATTALSAGDVVHVHPAE